MGLFQAQLISNESANNIRWKEANLAKCLDIIFSDRGAVRWELTPHTFHIIQHTTYKHHHQFFARFQLNTSRNRRQKKHAFRTHEPKINILNREK